MRGWQSSHNHFVVSDTSLKPFQACDCVLHSSARVSSTNRQHASAQGLAGSVLAPGGLLPLQRAFTTSAAPWKASEPAFEHSEERDECSFQTKIWEVLQTKDTGRRLWVSDECMVLDAVKRMAQNDVGSLLVYDKDKAGPDGEVPTSIAACVGIITERDYLKKVVLKGLASANTPVSKIMTPQGQLAVLTPQHSVLEAMDLMVKYNVRHVPVIEPKAANMAGVLSMKDVIKVLLDDRKHEVDSLKDYIHGSW
ncbi:hypothetical protein COO60DRAFT_724757 [Scenedesmus sp. NREL 46B-D3]|nr:hypothetical protein COO60DRAFT_724757 [Scenedesmus sp. NREL 46B-D3]